MRLNNSFLITQWEKGTSLKKFFFNSQNNRNIPEFKNLSERDWKVRSFFASKTIVSPKNQRIYYITPKAQEESSKICEGRKFSTLWFKDIQEQITYFVTGRDEFYRFEKGADYIYMLFFYLYNDPKVGIVPRYQTNYFHLDGSEININEWQQRDIVDRFLNILLFVELGEIELITVGPNKKVRYGKGGDEKLFNESGLNGVKIVTPNWNKIIVIEGGFKVRSHWRVQPFGSRIDPKYKLVQIKEYTKSGIIRIN